MATTRNRAKKQQIVSELATRVLTGDEASEISKAAGTSLVGVTKDTSVETKCTDVQKQLFKTGCVAYHPSQFYPPRSDEYIKLLGDCLDLVRNDKRCLGRARYEGEMVSPLWPAKVIIDEADIVRRISDLMPAPDVYRNLTAKGRSEYIAIVFTFKQRYLGEFVELRLRLNIEDFNDDIPMDLFNKEDYETIALKNFRLDQMLQFINDMCTKPYVDLEYGTDVDTTEVIRLNGNIRGQRIYIREVLGFESRVLMDVIRT